MIWLLYHGPNLNLLNILVHLDFFTCWIVDFCLMMYMVATWQGSKKRFENGRNPHIGGPN